MNYKGTIVIEFNEAYLKVVQSAGSGASKVISYAATQGIERFSDDEISAAIKDLLPVQGNKLREHQIIGVIPRHLVITRYLSLPSHDDKEIAKMVELQAVQQIPYSREDVALAHLIIEKAASGYAKVLVFILPSEIVNRYMDILQESGLTVSLLTVGSLGYFYWQSQRLLKHKEKGVGNIFVCVEPNVTEVTFFYQNNLLFSRSFRTGFNDYHASGVGELIKQTELTIANFRKEKFNQVLNSMIVLAPPGLATPWLQEVGERIQIPVTLLSVALEVPVQKNFTWSNHLLQQDSILGAVLGLGLAEQPKLVNLIPQQVLTQKSARHWQSQVVKVAAWAAALCILGIAIMSVESIQKRVQLNQLEQQLKDLKGRVSVVQNQTSIVQSVDDHLAKNVQIAEVFSELARILPENTTLTMMSLTGQKELAIQGFSSQSEEVNRFQQEMSRSKKFSNVVLDYVNRRKGSQGDTVHFKITTRLNEG